MPDSDTLSNKAFQSMVKKEGDHNFLNAMSYVKTPLAIPTKSSYIVFCDYISLKVEVF